MSPMECPHANAADAPAVAEPYSTSLDCIPGRANWMTCRLPVKNLLSLSRTSRLMSQPSGRAQLQLAKTSAQRRCSLLRRAALSAAFWASKPCGERADASHACQKASSLNSLTADWRLGAKNHAGAQFCTDAWGAVLQVLQFGATARASPTAPAQSLERRGAPRKNAHGAQNEART